jgi:hypothetical protein
MRGVFQDGSLRQHAAGLARAAAGVSHLLRPHLLRPHHLRRQHLRRQHPSRLAEALEPRLLLAVSPVGPEFLVNTTAAGAQRAAAVAADADGDFVVAWQAPDEAGLDIEVYARRYDAAGAPVGDKFRVNTTTSRTDFAILAANFGRTGQPYAAGDLNGDGFVNGTDFAILAGNFGKTIPAPPVAVAPAGAGAAAAPGLPSPARGAAPHPRRSLAFAAATPAKLPRRLPGRGLLSRLTRARSAV